MRNALVETATGLVVNVVEIELGDGSTDAPGFVHVPSDSADIGDVWDGHQIIPQPAPPFVPRK